MKKSVWVWILAAGAALAGIVYLVFLSKSPAPLPPAPFPIADVRVVSPQTEEVPVYRTVPGEVVSASEVTLASKILGRVAMLKVREGDRVRAGETLIQLDDTEIRAQLARAEADLENAKANLDRVTRLLAGHAATEQERDNAQRTYKVAEATKRALEANQAEASIIAPFDGTITERWVEPGEVVSPGRPLLKLEDYRRLRLEAVVPETEVAALRRGSLVRVELDIQGEGVMEGRVAQILPSADPATHSLLVKVDLPPSPGLSTGLYGRLSYPTGVRKTLLVPQSAVLERGQLSRIFVAEPSGEIRSRMVKTGTLTGGRIEILSGLRPGERVVAEARADLEGRRLPPAEEARP